MKHEFNLVWIDLEMTGLEIQKDTILEIATVITDGHLNIIAEGPQLVIHHSAEQLEAMNEWCIIQHNLSGLTAAAAASTTTLQQAQEETLEFIKQYCPPKKGILAGNSIWQDRNFLAEYMPPVIDYLSYKMVDVTSVQQLLKRWYTGNKNIEFKKQEMHRALPDIRESIDELKHYRQYFFIE